jgi:hypothetical protein
LKGLLRVLPLVLLAILLGLVGGVGSARAAAGTIVGPGESIQKAVNAADPGDAIIVSGVHHEDVVIRKNGISLLGQDNAVIAPPARVGSPCGPSGICILGDVNFKNGTVNEGVKNVKIGGLTVKNFSGQGIFAVGARRYVHGQSPRRQRGVRSLRPLFDGDEDDLERGPGLG